MGLGPGRIPWTAVKSYGETFGIRDPDELAAFAEIIFRMDQAYLDCQREGETAEPLGKGGRGRAGPGRPR